MIRNGHAMMSRITGTGCVLSALLGAFAGANPEPESLVVATACAVSLMGLAGEEAYARTVASDGGTGTFRVLLIDAISRMTAERLAVGVRMVERVQA